MYLAKASGEISLVSETAQPRHLPHRPGSIEQVIARRVHPALEHQLSEGLADFLAQPVRQIRR